MICKNCGFELSDNEKYCAKCGTLAISETWEVPLPFSKPTFVSVTAESDTHESSNSELPTEPLPTLKKPSETIDMSKPSEAEEKSETIIEKKDIQKGKPVSILVISVIFGILVFVFVLVSLVTAAISSAIIGQKISQQVSNVNISEMVIGKAILNNEDIVEMLEEQGFELDDIDDNSTVVDAIATLAPIPGLDEEDVPDMLKKMKVNEYLGDIVASFEDYIITGNSENLLSSRKIKNYVDKYADIKYENESIMIGESEEECTAITVSFDSDALVEILDKLADTIENDDYINSLFENENSSGYYYTSPVESLCNSMHRISDQITNYDDGTELTIVNYVNGSNKPIGMKCSFKSGSSDYKHEYLRVESLDNDKNMSLRFYMNGGKMVDMNGFREGDHGEMTVKVDPNAMSSYNSTDMKMTFKVVFSDVRNFTAFGREMTGGKCVISLKSAPFISNTINRTIEYKFGQTISDIFSSMVTDFIKSGEVSLSLMPEGKGYKTSFGVGIKDYCSACIYFALTPETDITDVNKSKVVDFNDIDQTDIQELAVDAAKYIIKQTGKDTEIKLLNEAIELLTGVNVLDMLENVEDYTDYITGTFGY